MEDLKPTRPMPVGAAPTASLAWPAPEGDSSSVRAFVLLLSGVHLMAAAADASHVVVVRAAGAPLLPTMLAHTWPSIAVVGLSLGAYATLPRVAEPLQRGKLLVGLYVLHCIGTGYLDALSISLTSYTIQHSWLPLTAIAYTLLIAAPLKHHLRMQALTALVGPVMVGARWLLGGYGEADASVVFTMLLGNALPIWIASLVSLLLFVYMSRQREDIKEAAAQSAQMGSYILERKLGEGGMGEVWKARHTFLARPAALKVIRTDDLDATEPGDGQESADTIAARFDREARVTAALTSPHTVRLYDFGQATTGTYFYAMEYLKGMDLERLVEDYGPQPQERVVHILRQVCDSLAEAHIAGLIHRDIKPANIMLCRQGTQQDFVKVLDFGLVMGRSASHLEGLMGEEMPPVNQRLTEQGIIRGTPACMSPEQAMADKNIDHRTDIYALGCVAYYLLTGRDVFEAPTSLAVLVQHLKSAPKLPTQRVAGLQIHEDLEVLIMQCLAKDPAGRPQRAQDLVRALDGLNIPVWTQADAVRWHARLGHLQEGPDASAQWVIPQELRDRLMRARSSDTFEQGVAPGATLSRQPNRKPAATPVYPKPR
jgi:serine/threonine-protein kinase